MDAGHESGSSRVLFVVVLEQLAGFLIESRIWERLDEQAAYDHEHMPKAHVRSPVLLENAHTDFACCGYVGVEDLGEEGALGRTRWMVCCKRQAHSEETTLERRAWGSGYERHVVRAEVSADGGVDMTQIACRALLGGDGHCWLF